MTDITQDFGIQSWCLRGFKDNRQVAQIVRDLGLDRIELCGAHCNFGDVGRHAPTIQTYRDAGVTIQSIGVETLTGEADRDRPRFEFCKAAGLRYMSVNFEPDSFERAHPLAQKLAEEYDIRCGIHNHGGYHWLGNSQILHWVYSVVGDRIGLCLDTAWALNARQDPVRMVEAFGQRLFAVHLKDFVFHHPDGQHEDVTVGTGNLDLPALKAACEQVGFNGEAVLEYEREQDVDQPVPPLTRCIEAIRNTP